MTELTRQEFEGQVWESWSKTLYRGSLAMERQHGVGEAPDSREVVTRDGAGRAIRLDIDGAGLGRQVDGTPDLRTQWTYDAAGRLSRLEQDGTDMVDAPIVDGVWDAVTRYAPGCESAAVLPFEVYRLPAWVGRY